MYGTTRFKSDYAHESGNLLNKTLDDLGIIGEERQRKYEVLFTRYRNKGIHGQKLQIFINKKIINEMCYISESDGFPKFDPVDVRSPKLEQAKPSTKQYLETCLKSDQEARKHLESLSLHTQKTSNTTPNFKAARAESWRRYNSETDQGRLFLHPKFLMNPDLVKIYAYAPHNQSPWQANLSNQILRYYLWKDIRELNLGESDHFPEPKTYASL